MQSRTVLLLTLILLSNIGILQGQPDVVSDVIIETHGGAEVEWVRNPTHGGEEAIRMYFTSESKHAIVKVPYNKPLSSLGSVHFTVKYTHSRPRFAIILDLNDDTVADTMLLSDYAVDGNDQWVQLWGGSRWGWDETDYPLSSYGGPWQELSNYVNQYPDATVTELGIVAEYWAFEPKGIGESLYVDGVEINDVYYDFESSGVVETPLPEVPDSDVSLSLQPEIIMCPVFDEENVKVAIIANLYVSNVVNLYRFTWDTEYDSEYLEYWDVRLSPEVAQITGGSHRSSSTLTFARNSFTGSGILLQFYFLPKMVSESEFKVYNIYLYDSSDNLIGTGRSSCEVQIIPLAEWVDGDYEELSEAYLSVAEQYSELQSDFTSLNSSYTELETANQDLTSLNEQLESQIDAIELNVENLTSQVEELQNEIDTLKSQQIPGFPLTTLIIGVLAAMFFAYMRIGESRT